MPHHGAARFAFVDDDRELRLGVFETVDGLFTGHTAAESHAEFVAASDWFPVEFTAGGLRPDQPVPVGEELGWCSVEILSGAGEPIGFYDLGSTEVERLVPRADGSFDATVTGLMTKPPERGVEAIWDRWRAGPPDAVNTWAELPAGRREAWLEVAGKYRWRDRLRRGVRHDRPGEELPVLILDGQYATDLASVYCALGEAVNGPGGYYGSNPYALQDCLRDGWGLAAPFVLVWRRFEVARGQVDGPALDTVLAVLETAGVRVEQQ
ncbi:barstar family protein [Actinoplanes sp. NPDC049596]|uniref:barstar family protein n=1 Tax=unclassified Actinoplanes TaxID=2626549 RepID=UPI003416BDC3